MKTKLAMLALMFVFEAQSSQISLSQGTVGFLARANPGFMKIEGKSRDSLSGHLAMENGETSGSITLNLQSLETGIELRDEHMKDKYLEVKKYPEAKLTLSPFHGLKLDEDSKGAFEGVLTLHGVSRPVKGEFEYVFKSNDLKANFDLKVSDFKIDVPSWMGVSVADSVQIFVESKLK